MFTSVEHQWTPLVTTLNELHRNKNKRKKTNTLEVTDIDYLIRKDRVTCNHYYRHKINALKKMIFHNDTLFGRFFDHYSVTKFHNMRSEHEQRLY